MKDYQIKTKVYDKDSVAMITCFLVHPNYDPQMLDEINYRSKALCWVGSKKTIGEALRVSGGDVLWGIVGEIDEFHLTSQGMFSELLIPAGEDRLHTMIEVVEKFIADTVRKLAD